jgi:hypothetical protein
MLLNKTLFARSIRTTMNIYTHGVPAALKEANSKMVNLVLPAQAACELNAPFSSLENLQLTVKKEILVGAVGIENSTIPPKAHEQRRCHRSYRDNHYKYHKTASLQGRPGIFTFRRTEVAEFWPRSHRFGCAPALGARGLEFKSPRPDQSFLKRATIPGP